MLLLAATTDSVELNTSSAATIDVHVSYVDASSTTGAVSGGGRTNTAFSSATTASILAAPAASTLRNVKKMSVFNKDGSLACDVIVRFNQNATIFQIWKCTLQPGDALMYDEGIGFFVVRPPINDYRTLSSVEQSESQRIFKSDITEGGTFLTISGTAYCVYVGRCTQSITIKFVQMHATGTVAAGAQTAEIGLFSSPSAPNKAAQTLTKIVATGTVDALTANGIKGNTSAFNQVVPAGTHLWAVFRGAMATTQVTAVGLANDMSSGAVLVLAGASALTGISTLAGGLIALSTSTVCPSLRVTLD